MQLKQKKKYTAIVKIENNPDGTARCLKYRFNDLLKFTAFLDQKWIQWKWFNLYSNSNQNKGKQLGSFTKNNKPTSKDL